MGSYNRVVLMGHLTRDPELRTTPSGAAVADLGLATNETFKNAAGEAVEKACFVDVVTWGKQAQVCAEYLAKGRPVLIEGRLQLDQWKTPAGEPRSKLRVRADRVQFIGPAQPQTATTSAKHPTDATEADPMPF
ncbi:MAG: single-stranded DNA-binding protein [Verrucomicrobia bacterium]|nr:single-stranded DNA-binding protein [Verrucomicrobiota bacterium]